MKDEATDPYEGAVVPLAQKHDLSWALDPNGAYVGGTDRESDLHFLAYDRGQVVGILKFRWHPGELHLAHILVAPAYRLRGRAGRLLDSFLAWAGTQRDLVGYTVTCEITAAEPERITDMLAKRGFAPSGHEWRRPL
jgi:GNAT superfamily N-acetyltransferase